MTNEQKLLIEIIKSGIVDKSITIPTLYDKAKLVRLIKKHSLQVLAYVVLKDNENFVEVVNSLKKEVYKLTIKSTALKVDSVDLIELLGSNGIICVPLKGYNIRKLYPVEDMRFSLDFDCLVKKQQVNLLEKVLEKNEYKYYKKTDMHIEYLSKRETLLEFHVKLFEDFLPKCFAEEVISEYTTQGKLSGETEYIIALSHLASHFIYGGVGIRNVIDLYLLNKLVDRSVLDAKLEKLNLKKFDNAFTSLAQVIFENKQANEFDEKLLNCIFNSSYLGGENSKEKFILALNYEGDLKKAKKKSFWKKVYPSYREMCNIYPNLKTKKWLLPFYHVARHFSIIFKRSSHLSKVKEIKEYNQAEIEEIKDILIGLGLDEINRKK